MPTKRAFTLIESLFYLAIFVVVMMALYWFLRYTRSTSQTASSGFAISQETTVAINRLRRDLRETSLQSVRVFQSPNDTQLTFASARDDQGKFQISRYGVPQWSRTVCYDLGAPDSSGLSHLIRCEFVQSFGNRIPSPVRQAFEGPKGETVVPSVLGPGWDVGPGPDGKMRGQARAGDLTVGGFRVGFVRRAADGTESMSNLNPNQADDSSQPGWSQGSTELVEARIIVADINSTSGQWSYVDVPIRVAPRH